MRVLVAILLTVTVVIGAIPHTQSLPRRCIPTITRPCLPFGERGTPVIVPTLPPRANR